MLLSCCKLNALMEGHADRQSKSSNPQLLGKDRLEA